MFIALITFIITWFAFSILYFLNENMHNNTLDATVDTLLSVPMLMLICSAYAILLPFFILYNMFKWTFKGIKSSIWESVKYKGMHYKQFGNFIFVYSPKNNFLHKFYIARLIKENDTVPTHKETPKETMNLKLPD